MEKRIPPSNTGHIFTVNAMFWVNAMDVILTQVPSICVVQASAAEAAGRGITVTVMGIYP